MYQFLKALFLKLRNVFAKKPVARNGRAKKRTSVINGRSKPSKGDEYSNFASLKDLLESLETHFEVLALLKIRASELHAQYHRFGCYLGPSEPVIKYDDVLDTPHILPAFCAVTFQSTPHDGRVPPRFACMQRIRAPRNCQPSPGVIYEVFLVFYCERRRRLYPVTYYVSVRDDRIVPLKSFTTRMQALPSGGHITHSEWRFPGWLHDLAADNGCRPSECGARVANAVLSAVSTHAHFLQVRAERNGVVARFGVDLLKTPYFFKHREADDNGRKRKIFHIVRTHSRQTQYGPTYVRSHFRGLRRFKWAGCEVTLSMPGTHTDWFPTDFGSDGLEEGDPDVRRSSVISAAEAAKMLDAADKQRGAA